MSLSWVDDLPADISLPTNRSKHGFQSLFDDPRFYKDWEEGQRLCDSAIPIPFFPDDLPTLKTSAFGWTPDELQDAVSQARVKLFPSRVY